MASTKLPPMSPLRPVSARGQPPPLNGSFPPPKDNMSAPHPFDGPYAIMKGLQVELGNLQAKVEWEQQQRAAEVQSLRDEVRLLREALAKERAERVGTTTSLSDKLASEIARHDKSLQVMHEQTSAALAARAMVDDLQNLGSRVKDLDESLRTEVEDRNKAFHNLDVRIDMNSQGDNEFAQQMTKEQSNLRQLLELNTSNDKVFAGWVEPRILMAGRLLQAGCGAPKLPPSVQLSERAKDGLKSPSATARTPLVPEPPLERTGSPGRPQLGQQRQYG